MSTPIYNLTATSIVTVNDKLYRIETFLNPTSNKYKLIGYRRTPEPRVPPSKHPTSLWQIIEINGKETEDATARFHELLQYFQSLKTTLY